MIHDLRLDGDDRRVQVWQFLDDQSYYLTHNTGTLAVVLSRWPN
jgi:hypothetical protein